VLVRMDSKNDVFVSVSVCSWRRGVVVSGVRRMNELTHVGPGWMGDRYRTVSWTCPDM